MPEAPSSPQTANTFQSLKAMFKESYGKCKKCGKPLKKKKS